MQFKCACKPLAAGRSFGEFREETDLDGAQERLRAPEAQTELEDPLGRRYVLGRGNVAACRHRFAFRP
jgi:hypothetical protein